MKRPLNFLPSPQLQDFIAAYGILEIPEGEVESYFSPPLALSGFIINLGKGKVIGKIKDRDFFTEAAVATGQVTSPIYGELFGEVKSIMVFFKPTGMHRLFKNNLSELTNRSKNLSDFLGKKEANLLLDKLIANNKNTDQVQILNDFFSGRIPDKNQDFKFEKILDYIHEKNGKVSIIDIEEKAYCSRKTLERQFRKKIGLTPKAYAQIYQFKCLINFLEINPEITWTQLADKSGYYDQSHMSRYIREYLEVSPNSIVKLDMQFINYLLNR